MLQPMKPDNPLARLKVDVGELWRAVTEMRSSMGNLENATIGRGGLTIRDSGALSLVDSNNDWLFRIRGDGTVAMINRQTNRGLSMIGASLWFYPDATTTDNRTRLSIYDDGTFYMLTPTGVTWVTGGDLRIYGLPTSTQSGNLRLQVDTGGIPRLYLGASSNEDLKPDLAPLEVAVRDVLQIEVNTWTDGDDQVAGVTVEQIQTLPSVAPLLVRPRVGGGESVEYDRLPVLQHLVLQNLDSRTTKLRQTVADQARTLVAQKAQIDALTARLDALEAGR